MKRKMTSLLKYFEYFQIHRDTNESIEKCMDNLDVIDLVLLPIEKALK